MLTSAFDARLENRLLVCFDAAGERLLSFDPLDVIAYAIEAPGKEPEWIMGGPPLAQSAENLANAEAAARKKRSQWRLPGLMRPAPNRQAM